MKADLEDGYNVFRLSCLERHVVEISTSYLYPEDEEAERYPWIARVIQHSASRGAMRETLHCSRRQPLHNHIEIWIITYQEAPPIMSWCTVQPLK